MTTNRKGQPCKCGRPGHVNNGSGECNTCAAERYEGRLCRCGRETITKGMNKCKICNREGVKRWRDSDPLRARAVERRGRIKFKYDMTEEEYDTLIARPCEICGTTEVARHCDHDHATGKVRGALCPRCNQVLERLEKDGWLDKAVAYLNK